MVFIPGISSIRGEPQSPEENEKAYEESQEQRALERKLRREKLDLEVMKAQGADEAAILTQRDRVRAASADIDEFCNATGRARRRNREYAPIMADFPDPDTYNPAQFERQTQQKMRQYFKEQSQPLQGMDPADTYKNLKARTEPENVQKKDTKYTIKQATVSQGSHTTPTGIVIDNADFYTMPDGMAFIFKHGMKKAQQSLTPEQLVTWYYDTPQTLREKSNQKAIAVVDRYNPQDPEWRERYKNFKHSYMTGGEEITIYRYDAEHDPDYFKESLRHEMGHGVDKSNGWMSDEAEWKDAMQKDKDYSGGVADSVSDYGKNSNHEDFAESVKKYTGSPTAFRTTFPNRAKILQKLLGDIE